MKIESNPRLPIEQKDLTLRLTTLFRNIAQQLNLLSEGSIQARHNAFTAAPAAGTYQKGDVVYNSNPSELGTAGSKYVLTHWICVTAGTPGTWKECRSLTGN